VRWRDEERGLVFMSVAVGGIGKGEAEVGGDREGIFICNLTQ
jgi:hypothetical protein